jgi:hypothetical protein
VEALAYLGTATADVNGDWDLLLPAELEEEEGLRTISTSRTYGVMQYFEVGTSCGLSTLYQPELAVALSGVTVSGPSTTPLEPEVIYGFSASVTPVTATLPITYTWEATDYAPQIVSGGVTKNLNLSWSVGGTKHITVTADNGVDGSVTGHLAVEVGVPPSSVTLSGPATTPLEPDVVYNFSASVTPVDATQPITYTWEATDLAPQIVSSGLSDDVDLSWTTEGQKQIDVTAYNGVGDPVTDSISIEVQSEEEYSYVFLPLVIRN